MCGPLGGISRPNQKFSSPPLSLPGASFVRRLPLTDHWSKSKAEKDRILDEMVPCLICSVRGVCFCGLPAHSRGVAAQRRPNANIHGQAASEGTLLGATCCCSRIRSWDSLRCQFGAAGARLHRSILLHRAKMRLKTAIVPNCWAQIAQANRLFAAGRYREARREANAISWARKSPRPLRLTPLQSTALTSTSRQLARCR